MKRFIHRGSICLAVLAAATFATTSTASAGDHHHHGHRGGFRSAYGGISIGGYRGYGGYNRGYGYGGYGYGYTQPRWHDTSHYDYHPTTVVPHGNHYHVIPGHYDYHQTGHWHY